MIQCVRNTHTNKQTCSEKERERERQVCVCVWERETVTVTDNEREREKQISTLRKFKQIDREKQRECDNGRET